MSAVEFEDHPTDPNKVILRKDRAVNSMSQGPRVWTPLPEHIKDALNQWHSKYNIMSYVEQWLKEANHGFMGEREREVLKLALEALEPLIVERTCEAMDAGEKAITAIKEALANHIEDNLAMVAQPEQEPVAAAMKTVIEAMQQDPDYAWGWHCNIAMSFVDAGGDHYTGNQGAARFMRTLANVEPAHELPSPPPQRTWVGLTDEEVKKIAYNTAERKVAKDIEAKLKEKNFS